MPSHDLAALERHVHRARDCFAKLGSTGDMEELIQIIKRPGWTTPAEFLMVQSSLEALTAHGEALLNMRQQLVNASRAVGKETVAAG